MATVFKARQFDYSGRTAGQMAFNKSSESVAILLHLHNDESSLRSILFLAQVSKKTNTCIIKLELYNEVRRMVQGRNMDIDAKLVLKQLEYFAESAEKEGSIPRPAKKPSSTQLTVDFSGLPVHQQQHALNRFKGDYKDTIVNLGDALKTERLVFLGEGGFGSVFAVPEQRIVLKVLKRPVGLPQLVKDISNEAASLHLATTLSRIVSGGLASRGKLLPFAPLPATEVCGSTSGAMALPSWDMDLYYPALIMQMASSTINDESKQLSKSFFADPMGIVSEEGFIRLASLIRLVTEPLAAMHSLNCAHRDVKEENILVLRINPGLQGYIHYNADGKKWTGRLGDCGKAPPVLWY